MDQKLRTAAWSCRGEFSGSFPGDCCVQDQFLSFFLFGRWISFRLHLHNIGVQAHSDQLCSCWSENILCEHRTQEKHAVKNNKKDGKKLLTKSDRHDKISELPRKNDNKEKIKKLLTTTWRYDKIYKLLEITTTNIDNWTVKNLERFWE